MTAATTSATELLGHLTATMQQLRTEIGHTPLVEVWPDTLPNGNRLFAKAEFTNPSGSHYDRIYAEIFETDLPHIAAQRLDYAIDVSSGSAAPSFAWFCHQLGLPCHIIIPRILPSLVDSYIREFNPDAQIRRPQSERPYIQGAIEDLKRELITARREGKHIYCPDHAKRDESLIATSNIADESVEQLRETYGVDSLDEFIVACGNGASIAGTARTLKQKYNNLHVTAFEPYEAPRGYNFKMDANEPSVGDHNLFGTGGMGVHLPFIVEERYGFKATVDTVVRVHKSQIEEAEQLRFNTAYAVGRTSLVGLYLALEKMKRVDNHTFLLIFYDRSEKYEFAHAERET